MISLHNRGRPSHGRSANNRAAGNTVWGNGEWSLAYQINGGDPVQLKGYLIEGTGLLKDGVTALITVEAATTGASAALKFSNPFGLLLSATRSTEFPYRYSSLGALNHIHFGSCNGRFNSAPWHAARPMTTLAIFAEYQNLRFDLNLLRAMPYRLGEGNRFGPREATELMSELIRRLTDLRGLARSQDAVDSPLFQLLTDYKAPDSPAMLLSGSEWP